MTTLAIIDLVMFTVFVVGPLLFACSDNNYRGSYWTAVGDSALLIGVLAGIVAVALAVTWAICTLHTELA